MNRILSLIMLMLCVHPSAAQNDDEGSSSSKRSYIHMLHTNVTRFDENINPDAWILVGDVRFRRDSMYMYCDSAHYFQKKELFPGLRQCAYGTGRYAVPVRRLS